MFDEILAAFQRSDTAKWMASAGEDLAKRAAAGEDRISELREVVETGQLHVKHPLADAVESFEALASVRQLELELQHTVARWLQSLARER